MPARPVVLALALAFGCSPKPATAPTSAAPSAQTAVGARAPDAQVTQGSGARIALADVVHQHAQTVVVFYRGFW